MDEEDEPRRYNPVVRVPAIPLDRTGGRPDVVEAPLDAATHWDERIWGRS
ncbi:hypothetical protein AB0H94_21160 [Streptomyces purpurascens]